MVQLDEEIIDVMKRIKDAIEDSSFKINRFSVAENGVGKSYLELDIRREEVEEE